MKNLYIYLLLLSISTFTYTNLSAQGTTCATSENLCNPNASFPATTGVSGLGSVGCLGSTPNPAFYSFSIAGGGHLAIDIVSSPLVDVDFAIWGPFSDVDGNCGGVFPTGAIADCSYSGASVELVDISNVSAGEFYILLVTNFSNNSTNITLSPAVGNTATLGGPLAFLATGPYTIADANVILTTSPAVTNPNVTNETFSGTGIVNSLTGEFSPALAGIGTHAINVTADSYGCGNASATIMIEVTAPPCTLAASLDNTTDIVCAGTNTGAVDISISGAQGIATYAWSNGNTTQDLSGVAAGTYSVVVTDSDGCTASLSATINTIADTENPTISCPSNITQGNDLGACGANVYFDVTATDNCSGVSYVCTTGGASNNCASNAIDLSITFDDYPGETSWYIENSGGTIVESGGTYGSQPSGSTLNLSFNLSNDNYTFVINDAFGDGICCFYGNGSYTLSNNGNILANGGNFGGLEAQGFCVGTTVGNSTVSGDFFPVGTTAVTCIATDAAGNTNTCTFDITVNDTEAPMINTACPSIITLCGAQNVTWSAPTATDNCGISMISSNYDSGDYFSIGTHTVTYVFTDLAGLTASCSFDVVINPEPIVGINAYNLAPFCQGIKELYAKVGNIGALTAPLTYEWSHGLGNTPAVIAALNNTQYTVTVTDANGCSSVTTYNLSVDMSTLLSAHVLLADDELEMFASEVYGGGVGLIDADEDVSVHNNSHIFAFLKSDFASIDGTSSVGNYINASSTIALPPFVTNPNADNNNIMVAFGSTTTLSGSNYGNITVMPNATLIFDNPNVYIKNLVTKPKATISFTQATNLMVRIRVDLGSRNTFNADNMDVVMYIGDDFSVDQGSNVTADVFAQEGISANDSGSSMYTYMSGLFISYDGVESGDNVIWSWNVGCGTSVAPVSLIGQINTGNVETAVIAKELKVYPNPSNGIFSLEVNSYMDKTVDVTIYNTVGTIVWQSHINNLETSTIAVDLSNAQFTNGIYFVNVTAKGQTETKAIILNR